MCAIPPPANSTKWIIAVDLSNPIPKQQIMDAGFYIQNEMNEIGCVAGMATNEVAEKVRLIPGVIGVEPDIKVEHCI